MHSSIIPDSSKGMNIRWDYFVNQYDTARYVSSDGARDNRHIQFVREFASVVSILQVRVTYRPSITTSPHL